MRTGTTPRTRKDGEIMKKLNIERATERYNNIVCCFYEEHIIGESETTKHWNLRDMIAECDYILSTFYDEYSSRGECRHSDDAEERKYWSFWVGKLQRFISAYEPFIDSMVCTAKHCSKYD